MRIGVVGTGVMGSHHLRVLRALAPFRLTCAADSQQTNLETACRGLPILTFTDYRQMVEHVDVVAVATPTGDHYPISRFFLENGKHVLVEKPMTQTVAQADELIHLAARNDVRLAVGHLERFNPAVEYLRTRVDQPRFIEVQRLGSFSLRSLDIDVILDLMIHDLDIILQFDRSGVREIRAVGVPVISAKIDIAHVRLEFHSGLVASLTSSRVSQAKIRKLRLFQKNLYFSVDYQQQTVKQVQLRDREIAVEEPIIEPREPLQNLWFNFGRTLSSGQNFNATGEEGRDALQLALRISEAIAAGHGR